MARISQTSTLVLSRSKNLTANGNLEILPPLMVIWEGEKWQIHSYGHLIFAHLKIPSPKNIFLPMATGIRHSFSDEGSPSRIV